MDRKQLYLKREPIWIAFTADKKPFQLKRGRTGWEYHTQAEAQAHIERYAKQGKTLYLGIQLRKELGLVCIDIDRKFTVREAQDYVARLCERFELYDVYAEFSLSGNLHVFFRAENLPQDRTRLYGTLLGETVEIYWAKQAILLTQNLVPDTHPELDTTSFADWYELEQAVVPRETTHKTTVPTTEPTTEPNRFSPPRAPEPSTLRSNRVRPRRLLLEILHLFPSFYEPYLQPFITKKCPHQRTRLRRPGKTSSHSATFFADTGVCYNFSTNWHNVPIARPIRLANFLCTAYGLTPQQLGQQFHRYLTLTSTKLGLPIPRRKSKRYYTLHRKRYHQFLVCLIAQSPKTPREIQTELATLIRYPVHRTTVQRILNELCMLGILKRKKHKRTYQYTITQNTEMFLRTYEHTEIGWQYIAFHQLLIQQARILNSIKNKTENLDLEKRITLVKQISKINLIQTEKATPPPPYVFLVHALHTYEPVQANKSVYIPP